MQAILNFYNDKIKIAIPLTYAALKKKICEYLYMNEEDVNEMEISTKIENKEKEIITAENYQDLLNTKKDLEIDLKIKETSELFKKEEKKLLKEIEKKEEPENNQNKLSTKIKEAYEKVGKIVEPYIKPIGNFINEKLKKEEEKVIHKKYICDGCEKNPITGIRYKCTVCDDFDYCEECEAKFAEKHGHPFLKIRRPEDAPVHIHCSYPSIKNS